MDAVQANETLVGVLPVSVRFDGAVGGGTLAVVAWVAGDWPELFPAAS